jgi:N-methylhydantoinase A
LVELVQRFHAEHAARFAHSDEADVVEIATLRLAAIGRMPDPELADTAKAAGDPVPPKPSGNRRVWLDDAWADAQIYQRTEIEPGASLTGPAIIEEAFTTLVVPARWTVTMTPSGDMIAEKNG